MGTSPVVEDFRGKIELPEQNHETDSLDTGKPKTSDLGVGS